MGVIFSTPRQLHLQFLSLTFFFGRDTIYQIENNEIEVELGQHYESKSFKRTKVQFVLDARIGGRGVHAMFFRKLR